MDMRSTRRTILLSAGAAVTAGAVAAGSSRAPAQSATPLRVVSFPGLSNLSIYAAQQQNLFSKYQLADELAYPPNSQAQRDGLAKGESQIIHTAADNAVAMVELAKQDAVIVSGGDNGFNRIFAQPDVKSLADLRKAAKAAGIAMPDKTSKHHQDHVARFEKMDSKSFDKAYVGHVIHDHEEDVALFEQASKDVKNYDLRKYADQTLPVIRDHLKMIKKVGDTLGVKGEDKRK